ncbi:hypothetical protein ACFYVL_14055 [Streptomyces sp. NPDC004111]|uniref:hypothetical protein n=1 Tax=Streptomyces sp. NPDC004111 TaxID=3364690 RepID=UPI0036B6A178
MSSLGLSDWQLEFGGVVLGHNTRIPVAEIEGLGLAEVRGEAVPQPGADGVWPAPDWYGTRTLRIDCGIKTPGDPVAAGRLLGDLLRAADTASVRTVGGALMGLRIKWPGAPVRVLYGRMRKLDPVWAEAAHGWIPLDVEFLVTDPRFYSDTEQQASLRLAWLSGGGFTAPVKAPIRVTDGVDADDRPGWVFNAGDAPAHPVLTVHGPCASPTIRHVSSGQVLTLPSLDLAAGQWVEIDTRPGRMTVLRDNGGSAAGALTTASRMDEFVLPPGRSEIRWAATDPTSSARLTVRWRDAHIALYDKDPKTR